MLCAIEFLPRAGITEEREKRTLALFRKWQIPDGVDFKGFYDYADGNGGIAIVEADSAELMLETIAPWSAYFQFTIRPLVPVEKSVEIVEKAYAWRDSIS
jgi:hypothetical protein